MCKLARSQGDDRSYLGIGTRFLGPIRIYIPKFAPRIPSVLVRMKFWRGTGARCMASGSILSHEGLGGLHHRYDRAA
jgi:hypothetical protein